MNTLNAYSSSGGQLYPLLDKRPFSFSNDQAVNLTIKEQRNESINPTVFPQNIRTDNTVQRIEFNVPYASDGSMYDLKNTYIECTFAHGNLFANNVGLAPFCADSMITDCQVFLNSTLVSEQHTNLYPWASLAKNLLIEKRPCVPGLTSGFISEDCVEEGLYMSHPLLTTITAAGGGGGVDAYNFTKTYMNNGAMTFRVKLRLKEGIFMQPNFISADMNLRIVLFLNIYQGFIDQAEILVGSVGNNPVTLTNIQLQLQRVMLTEDAKRGLSGGLNVSTLKYPLLYCKIETKTIPNGSLNFNTHIFTSQTKPNLLIFFVQHNPANLAAQAAQPYLVCGSNVSGTGARTSPQIQSLFVRVNGKQYPKPEGNSLSCYDILTYRRYVDMCLEDSQDVYLDFLHWQNQYTAYVINLNDDVMGKMWGMQSFDELTSIDVYMSFFPPGTTVTSTLYCIAMSHASIEVDAKGNITKRNYVS